MHTLNEEGENEMGVVLPIKNVTHSYEINPSKIIALGFNYLDHIKEKNSINIKGFPNELPMEPILFPKTPNVLIGSGEPIVIPSFVKRYNFENPRVDYEAELALIISKKCKNVLPHDAFDCILGFTCMNDVSQRNIQNSDNSGWFRGKSFDTFGPIGPVIVRPDDIGNVQELKIICRLNGHVVQEASTALMIFPIDKIVSFVSHNFTLEVGDIIMTGTPSGVGAIKHGDIVEIEIENIGILKNPVIEE